MKLTPCFWLLMVSSLGALETVHSFLPPCSSISRNVALKVTNFSLEDLDSISPSRRLLLGSAVVASSSLVFGGLVPDSANAAVGTLPEFADSNAIIQGLTVNVADKSQQDGMIDFLVNGFDFQVLRKRIKGSVEETVGFKNHLVGTIS